MRARDGWGEKVKECEEGGTIAQWRWFSLVAVHRFCYKGDYIASSNLLLDPAHPLLLLYH